MKPDQSGQAFSLGVEHSGVPSGAPSDPVV